LQIKDVLSSICYCCTFHPNITAAGATDASFPFFSIRVAKERTSQNVAMLDIFQNVTVFEVSEITYLFSLASALLETV
jgi:hypothetical protein